MSIARTIRIILAIGLVAGGFFWVLRTDAKPEKVNLIIAATIGAVTTIYALFTYEILVQNQKMAKAALDSATYMERSLRFTYTPNLLFRTMNTKDPTFSSLQGTITPIENADYKRAVAEYTSGNEQKEFVFALVENKGQGMATKLDIEATYDITDSSSPNRESSVTKRTSVQILEPNKGIALCIFISKIPTPDDQVTLVSARLISSDFYRDGIGEPLRELVIDKKAHHVELASNCVVRLA
jgi:hypothetical protein